MAQSQQGYLIISDITGYTAYLSQAELEHAQGILSELFDTMLEYTRPPLVISRFDGDAIICYAPDGSFLQGQTLVEAIENTYVAFRRTVKRMRPTPPALARPAPSSRNSTSSSSFITENSSYSSSARKSSCWAATST